MVKKDSDRRFIANWRPVSLLNIDTKLIPKTLTMRLKKVLPALISSTQTADVTNTFISEHGRLISDILEVKNTLNMAMVSCNSR